jgi:hypothetical protein
MTVDKAVSSCERIHREWSVMEVADEVAFLFDVDNMLLDNDQVEKDLRDHLEYEFGAGSCHRYWTIFEERRQELGYADYLGALQRIRHAGTQRAVRTSLIIMSPPLTQNRTEMCF